MLGIVTNPVVLPGKIIQINMLLEKVDQGLLDGATEVTVHQYARCYILALLGEIGRASCRERVCYAV